MWERKNGIFNNFKQDFIGTTIHIFKQKLIITNLKYISYIVYLKWTVKH